MSSLIWRRLSCLALCGIVFTVGCRHSRCHCTHGRCGMKNCVALGDKASSKDAVVTPVGLKTKNGAGGVVAITVFAPPAGDASVGSIGGTCLMSRADAEAIGLRPGYSPNVLIVEDEPKTIAVEKAAEPVEKGTPYYLPEAR